MRKSAMLFMVFFSAMFLLGRGQLGPQLNAKPIDGIKAPAGATLKIDTDYGKMPLYFIPNQGQLDKQVAYYVQGKDKTLYFTEKGITFALTKPGPKGDLPAVPDASGSSRGLREDILSAREAGLRTKKADPEGTVDGGSGHGPGDASGRWIVKLEFVGANEDVKPVGEAETGTVVSYFKGKPEEWQPGLPTYSKIVYPNLWPGVDLIYYGTVNRLKYEFIVHPGAEPSKIRLAYRGADSVSIDREGRLNVATPDGGFADDVPAAYQEINGERVEVPLAYRLSVNGARGAGKNAAAGYAGREFMYGFEVGDYDRSLPAGPRPLYPDLLRLHRWSSTDYGWGIAVDRPGNAYVTGWTSSTEAMFPETVGPDLTQAVALDAFVAKVNSSGTALVYCGYIGGSSSDYGYGIAVDGSGNAYVTGEPPPPKPRSP